MKLFLLTLLITLNINSAFSQEKLNRAPVAVKASNGILVSWRSLNTDKENTTFSVYRDGEKIASSISNKTNFLDKAGKEGNVYTVETEVGGEVVETVNTTAWNNMCKSIKVKRPAPTKDASAELTGYYFPDDASVGDVDGDGQYEIILKWFPDNQRDSGKEGKASPTYMGCYKMDGKALWENYINFGHNIRSGNHTMQFVVYDFDGDGKAEIICRTAAGTTDAKGKYVSKASTDANILATDNSKTYQNSKGYVTGGEEFLSVFNGETGEVMQTIWYRPNRGLEDTPTKMGVLSSSWGDSYGGRAERFNAAVAYLDGMDGRPSAIMQRGYYTQCYIWAVNWDGSNLTTKWLHRGTTKTAWSVIDGNGATTATGSGQSSYAQGVHGISVGDIDGDGCDEIVTGSATIDHDGKLLCSTGKGHGDAIHLADLCPDIPGLEVMMPHEERPFGYDVHKAADGTFLANGTSEKDNGRGLAADFIPSHKGSEFWSAANNNMYACENGAVLATSKPDCNFRIYWTGDPFDQTFDGRYDSDTYKSSPRIRAWNTAGKKIVDVVSFASHGSPQTCNTTKATPCLQADILGDWREEIIMYKYEDNRNASDMTLMIFSTPEPTNYKVNCLMQDHLYRMGVAWQNSSYNQPPHLGYSLAEALGINRSNYTTNTTSHAPTYKEDATPEDPTVEKIECIDGSHYPSADKETFKGVSYTAGENGEFTASTKGDYVKTRTGNNDQIVFTVNEGYIITSVEVQGYSNNTSTTADRSIDLTGIYVDDSETSLLAHTVTFPGGTAGQTAKTATAKDFNATQKITLTFDNSKIVDSATDSAGKNKQIFAKFTFTYKKASASGIQTTTQATCHQQTGCYNIMGQRISKPQKHGINIINGRKVISAR